jgi:molybdate transport system regulatory protein
MISKIDRMSVQTKVWLEKDGKPVFGIGKLGLFKAIKKEGSISKASKRMNISFRRAWSHLDNAERNFGTPLLEKHKGGKGGGRSSLTGEAEELASKFERLSDEVREFAERRFLEIFNSSVHDR